MKLKITLFILLTVVIFISCKKEIEQSNRTSDVQDNISINKSLSPFLEDFETGTKASYATGNVTFSTGAWTLNDALLGTSASDVKNGLQSTRVRNTGKLTMLTDKTTGAGTVTIKHAAYGSDASSDWQLWYSTNSGTSYVQAGSNVTSAAGALQTVVFTLNIEGNIRIEIRKNSGGTNRINIDDIAVSNYTSTQPPTGNTKKFLFDAKHAQTAGNADWVIDSDSGIPGFNPTPAQSNVTSTTSETYWTGGISAWGIALAKMGHVVQTLPSSGSLTYGNASNTLDLSNYNVFVVDEPNTLFTAAEKTAILQFVQNGGSLFMIGNHNQSDRNNDGYDAPAIWNNLMTSNSVQTNPFGFSFNLLNVSGTTSNLASTASNPILNGSQGLVTSIQFNSGTSMTMVPSANSTVTGLIWKSGVTKNNNNVFCLRCTYGSGRVVAIGDSSPMDDGTGNPSDILYPGWTTLSHSKLMLNASLWLAGL
jgi:hypothetical protein